MLQEWSQNKIFKGLVFVFLVLAIVALLAYARLAYKQGDSFAYGETISVVGTSEIFVKPDIAEFSYSVMAENEDATAAQGQSAEKSNAIKAYLKEMGVEEGDIKTTYYNLMPKYEWEAVPSYDTSIMMYPPTNQVVVGYTAEEMVTVKVRSTTEKAGELIAGVGSKGATNVSSLMFTVDDSDEAKAQVQAEAIAEAKEKARTLAKNLGVRLGDLQTYYDNEPMSSYSEYAGGMMRMDAVSNIAPQVSAGENKISASVTLVYKIH